MGVVCKRTTGVSIMFYTFKEETIEYILKFSNRKSIELRIDATGIVQLKAPKGMPEDQVIKSLEKKWDWILKSLKKVSLTESGFEKRTYESGEQLNILGKVCTLTVHRQNIEKCRIQRMNDELILSVPKTFYVLNFHQLLEEYLKRVLKNYIHKRVLFFEEHYKVKINKISVRNQKTRWGSCSSGRNLSFNFRLAMAPLEVIDYIIVHEMCHLEHMNHSKSYWKKVYEVMPEYEKHELWLKNHGRSLSLEVMER